MKTALMPLLIARADAPWSVSSAEEPANFGVGRPAVAIAARAWSSVAPRPCAGLVTGLVEALWALAEATVAKPIVEATRMVAISRAPRECEEFRCITL